MTEVEAGRWRSAWESSDSDVVDLSDLNAANREPPLIC